MSDGITAGGGDGAQAPSPLPLQALGINKRFGGVAAITDASLTVGVGEIHALIGPNGAGKSTMVNVVSGLTRPDSGTVSLFGRPCGRTSAVHRAHRGLARTFQHPALFGTLTIAENLRLAERKRSVATPAAMTWLASLPDQLALSPWMDVVANAAPDPVRKLADTLRALTTLPKLLLVDEPAAGLTAEEREKLGDLFQGAREHLGCSILLIEHDVPLVFRICDRVTVLSNGALIADGTPAEIRAHPEVIRAYLGEPI